MERKTILFTLDWPTEQRWREACFHCHCHPPNLPPSLKSIFSHQMPLPGTLGPGPDHNGHWQLQGLLSYAVLAAVTTIAVATIHWIFLMGCWTLTFYTDLKEKYSPWCSHCTDSWTFYDFLKITQILLSLKSRSVWSQCNVFSLRDNFISENFCAFPQIQDHS